MKFGKTEQQIQLGWEIRIEQSKVPVKTRKFAWLPTSMDNTGRVIWLEHYYSYDRYHGMYLNAWDNRQTPRFETIRDEEGAPPSSFT